MIKKLLKRLSYKYVDKSVAVLTLADVLREQSREIMEGDLDEWGSVKDLLNAVTNNIKHDMGERMGHPCLFFENKEAEKS